MMSDRARQELAAGRPVSIVYVPVGVPVRDGLLHLSSECELIADPGVRPARLSDVREVCRIPVFCEACGPFSMLML
jgi:hypothetical protein